MWKCRRPASLTISGLRILVIGRIAILTISDGPTGSSVPRVPWGTRTGGEFIWLLLPLAAWVAAAPGRTGRAFRKGRPPRPRGLPRGGPLSPDREAPSAGGPL